MPSERICGRASPFITSAGSSFRLFVLYDLPTDGILTAVFQKAARERMAILWKTFLTFGTEGFQFYMFISVIVGICQDRHRYEINMGVLNKTTI